MHKHVLLFASLFAFQAEATEVTVIAAWKSGEESISWVQTTDWESHFYYQVDSQTVELVGAEMPDLEEGGRYFFFDPSLDGHFGRLTSRAPRSSAHMAEMEYDQEHLSYTRVYPDAPRLYILCGNQFRAFSRVNDDEKASLEKGFSEPNAVSRPRVTDGFEWIDTYVDREDPSVSLLLTERVDFSDSKALPFPSGTLTLAQRHDPKGSEAFESIGTDAEPETYYRGEWLVRHYIVSKEGVTGQVDVRGSDIFHDRPYLFFKPKGEKVGRVFDRSESKLNFTWTHPGPCSNPSRRSKDR